jgi:uncharacterized protein
MDKNETQTSPPQNDKIDLLLMRLRGIDPSVTQRETAANAEPFRNQDPFNDQPPPDPFNDQPPPDPFNDQPPPDPFNDQPPPDPFNDQPPPDPFNDQPPPDPFNDQPPPDPFTDQPPLGGWVAAMKPRLLILQPSSLCNLNCTYCYVPNRQNRTAMSDTTLRAALQLLLSRSVPGDSVRILWHAGEPLAVGLKFFEGAAEIIRGCTPRGVRISQIIQTNGTLINEEWCRFFVREKILVGLSIDGPAVVHDRQRRNLGDGPTHAGVMRGLRLLEKHGIALHAISVLTPHSLDFADEIFDFFIEAGVKSVGFNLEETEGVHTSVFGKQKAGAARSREKYKIFMSRLFDRWNGAGKRPRIREFESMSFAIGTFLRNHNFYRTADDLIPFNNIAVTRDGEISTFSPELASGTPSNPFRFSLGNVHRVSSFEELATSQKFQELAKEVKKGVDRCRSECEYFPICGGGMASNKFYENGTFDCAETTACALHRKTLADVVADGLRAVSVSKETPANDSVFAANLCLAGVERGLW